MPISRRKFFGAAGAGLAGAEQRRGPIRIESPASDLCVSLNGAWRFRLDAQKEWREVRVPHTWQTEPESAEYLGAAWYERELEIPSEWRGWAVRIEFEAVYHTARVWLNGALLGEHRGKGYTEFGFDLTPHLRYGVSNVISLRVDNSFDRSMLPRGNSYDWTPDGGITRPVSLLVTPPLHLERVDVDAVPDLTTGTATLRVRAALRNSSGGALSGEIGYEVREEDTARVVARGQAAATVEPWRELELDLPPPTIEQARLWHFDQPNLYRLAARIGSHGFETVFGVRKIEVRQGGLYLNGERVWLAGVERMAGSHPEYGMAEPEEWIRHDHDDLKELNCVFTRVHWQQDKRVLDYCDRHGILIQEEVPTWGSDTFADMREVVAPEIVENGLEQLRETIRRDRNHPSIVSWGLCNEVNGQHPASQQFVRRMLQEARALDPGRLLSYASNSLQTTPAKDVAGELDFIEWNEYYETWYGGDPEAVRSNLEEIQKAFPGKMIVISEYGYCACTPDRPEGDARRIEILRAHNAVFRRNPGVGGLIFFCYNDYRTHMGDKGLGVMRQRVHGVVDLYGARKPSYEVLRQESSPIAGIEVSGQAPGLRARVRTRREIPAYTLRGYKLRWTVYGAGNIPIEKHESPLPVLEPGQEHSLTLDFREPNPVRVEIDVVRPTGFSACTETWPGPGARRV